MSKYDKLDRWCPNQPASMSLRKDGRYIRYDDAKELLEACKRKDVVINDLITIALFVCQDCVHKDNCFREGKKVEKCKSWARIQAAKAELDREEI